MRASRLLSIQMLLQARGRMSARELARELEVSVRTLYRDVEELAAAGVPIFAERGRAGGFELLAGWKATLTGLTPTETQAVFLSGLAGPAADLGLGAAVEAAKLKLLASMPQEWRGNAERVSSRLHLDPLDWYRDSEPVPFLAQIAAAVWEPALLAIEYESWKGLVKREVSPLGLVLKSGAWYLVGAVEDSPRTFKVANVRALNVLASPARRPKGFDLRRYWGESVQRFEQQLLQGRAIVLADAVGLGALRREGGAVARAVERVESSARTDKRLRVVIPIESIEHAAAQFMRLAPAVEVVEPRPLRVAIEQRLRAACRRYGVRPAP
jgi:predicted DNA-binding transcriptional regulator YafY